MKMRISALLLTLLLAVSALAGCGREIDPVVTTPAGTTAAAATTAAATTAAEAETTEAWTPTAEDYSRYFDDNGFLKGVTALDCIDLPDFAELIVSEKDDLATSDEDIEAVIASFLSSYLPDKDYDKVIEDGDTVCIAYTGYVDGKSFSGGSTGESGTSVTIGVTSYIDDFLEQLIGHKPGDDLSIEVTFPDPYTSNTDLSGKDAVFETTILYVETVPELTAELMEANADTFESYFNTDALTPEGLRQSIYDTFYSYNQSTKLSEFLEDIMANVTVPQAAYDAAYNATAISVNSYGLDMATYQAYYGYTDEEFEELINEDAKSLILYQAIAEKQGWNVTEAELKEYIGASYDSYKESMGIGYLAEYLLYSKATNYMLDTMTITD